MSFMARDFDQFDTLYAYLVNFAGKILYPANLSKYYREGKKTAIADCLNVVKNDQDNREVLEDFIAERQTYYKSRVKDEYMNGYLDGLKVMEKQMYAVKMVMMEKVKKLLQ